MNNLKYICKINFLDKYFNIYRDIEDKLIFYEIINNTFYDVKADDLSILNYIYINNNLYTVRKSKKSKRNILRFSIFSTAIIVTAIIRYKVDRVNPYNISLATISVGTSELSIEGPNIKIYDNNYLDNFLDFAPVSINMLVDAINENINLTEQYKLDLIQYVKIISKKFPDMDLRIFYENVKNLNIIELDNASENSNFTDGVIGCYQMKDNTIYILEQYVNNKFIVYHEITHALNNAYFNKDGIHYYRQFDRSYFIEDSSNLMIEGFDDYLTMSMLDYNDDDVGLYGYPIIRSLAKFIDNSSRIDYSLDDYVYNDYNYLVDKVNKGLERDDADEMFLLASVVEKSFMYGVDVDSNDNKKLLGYMFDIYMSDKNYSDSVNSIYVNYKLFIDELPFYFKIDDELKLSFLNEYLESNGFDSSFTVVDNHINSDLDKIKVKLI